MAQPKPDAEQMLALLDQYQRQIEAVARQLQFLQALHAEASRARTALAGLREEPGSEVLLPLGSNTFIHATATKKDKALVGIGAGLNVERSWAEAEERLAKREEEIRTEIDRLNEAGLRLQQEAASLEDEVQGGPEP